MHLSIDRLVRRRIENTVENLRKNRFDAQFIPDKKELLERVDGLWRPGATCAVGGSMSLEESGVLERLRSGNWDFIDRYAPGADQREVFLRSFGCDVFFMSSNAVTEDGYLYNMDGMGNRVAALAYGPEKVVVVAGRNKLVADVEAARERNRRIAAPANAHRLDRNTPCVKTGRCHDCRSEDRICATEVICRISKIPNRIAVWILPVELGF